MRDTRATIRQAFQFVEKPATESGIAPHPCSNCEQLGRDFLPYTWETLPQELIQKHFDALPLLEPHALQHYLPAYLLFGLEHPGSLVLEFTVYHLTPGEKAIAESDGYFEERFGLFSPEQRAAIGSFFADVRRDQLFQYTGQGELERAKYLWPDEA